MSTTTQSKSPGWLRGVQIGLGAVAVVLSIYALVFPAAAFVSVVFLISIVLFIVGIEKIITGIFLPAKGRWGTIGLGILVLIFAGLAIAFPGATAALVLIFISIALIFMGASRIVEGTTVQDSKWAKGFLIGVGILSIIVGGMILFSPVFGAVLVGIVIAIVLLIVGIQMIAVGAAGKRQIVKF